MSRVAKFGMGAEFQTLQYHSEIIQCSQFAERFKTNVKIATIGTSRRTRVSEGKPNIDIVGCY